jgi:hypothetical protein
MQKNKPTKNEHVAKAACTFFFVDPYSKSFSGTQDAHVEYQLQTSGSESISQTWVVIGFDKIMT